MKKFLKILKEIVIYVLIVVILIYAIPKILSYSLKVEHPMAAITSSSMWPALKQGDLVLIKGVDKEELGIGDVVVYSNEKGFTIHRIVKLNEKTLITKGDANNVNDNPIKYEQVVGRIVEFRDKPLRIPYVGLISVLISKYKT